MDKDKEILKALSVLTLPRHLRSLCCARALQQGYFNIPNEQLFIHRDSASEDILKRCLNKSIEMVTLVDETYPPLLREIEDPPPVLFVKGSKTVLPQTAVSVAVVGGRQASTESCGIAADFACKLAQVGAIVISGLALGIDGAAHRGALDARRAGATIAVLAHGLDITYPAQHRALAEEIQRTGGAVVSEYPPGCPPHKHNFPVRNRIIAGMSLGVLLVEARERSGSLITARWAVDSGRDVFVVPGPITQSRWRGSLELLRQGAIPAVKLTDITDHYGLKSLEKVVDAEHGENELEELFQQHGTLHINEIIRVFGDQDVFRKLLTLELAGVIRRLPGNFYVKSI
jgi:DNA processing protein